MMKKPGAEDLYFLPLGGAGEIGMNLNLYGHDGRWLMVDLGVLFADDGTPGIDVLMPDPDFIVERREDLAGLVLTHAHEDHIGAVPHLWRRLRCPIYATAFTAVVLRGKLQEAGLLEEAIITVVPLSGRFTVGPFEIELITLTHSIPEPNAVVIRTGAGTVMHTGDWKLDPDPLVGETYDETALRRLADEQVLAMVCDSTNALVEGDSGSERDVRDQLMELVGRLEHRVAVACFASNVARLETVFQVAKAHNRRVALVGRSMHKIVQAAVETGYLTDLPGLISDKDVGHLPREEVLLLCTGSQGEPRAALWRIAQGDHPQIVLDPGDAVIFSSRIIPGNERAILRLYNQLAGRRIEVITASDQAIHVSGHPARDELVQMYQWVRPQIAVPVHGETRHLIEHAALARQCQVPEAIVVADGSMVRLAPGPAGIVAQIPTGRLALDGKRLVPAGGEIVRDRQRLAFGGAAAVTLVLDETGHLAADAQVSLQGLIDLDSEEDLLEDLETAVEDALDRLPKGARKSDERVEEAARRALRRACHKAIGKKPVTDVHLVRLA
jgi:ribonuclease J